MSIRESSPSAVRTAVRNLVRAFCLSAVLVLMAFLQTAPASAASLREYAGIVLDAKTGQVLYSHKADERRYPASVTKVMTLYVIFEELEAGRLTLRSDFQISKHATNAPPTKLGLRAGNTIKVEDAIKALVTHSANDVARVIAENISGSESGFAERMTRTAKALGMTQTVYKNASGLPDSGQVTTVRDQVRLGAAVYQHFPNYYEYFQTRSFRWGGRNYGNHNRLLGSNGVDGIKTGYINASGYNLLTAARKDGRHIVVAGFGFNTGASRNEKVAQLVRDYLPKARSGSLFAEAAIPRPGVNGFGNRFASAEPVYPMPRPHGRDPVVMAIAAHNETPIPLLPPELEAGETAVQAVTRVATTNTPAVGGDAIGAWISKSLSFAVTPNVAPQPALPPVSIGESNASIDLMETAAVPAQRPVAEDGANWVVQVGAVPSEIGAQALIGDAAQKVRNLAGLQPYVERFDKNGLIFYRARFAGIGNRAQAKSVCDALKAADMACLALQG